jgi:hypothetical protein
MIEKFTFQYEPLYYIFEAITNNHLNIIGLLLECGLSIHHSNDRILTLAVEYGYINIVLFALFNGCDINAGNGLAIEMAIRQNYVKLVRILFKAGSQANKYGVNDSLRIAIDNESYLVVKEVLKYTDYDKQYLIKMSTLDYVTKPIQNLLKQKLLKL